ncbi:MAG: methyl-accepting chemotaxis protein [Syntrophotaleaceae bacterium]
MKNLKISYKIFLLSGSMLVIFTLVMSWMYFSAKTNVMDGRRQELRHLVESAWGVLDHYAQQAAQGLLSEEEAQERAKEAVKALRFGEDNYFWINDMQPRMIMHPTQENLVGQDLSQTKDSHDKAMFLEMVDLCRKEGQGFVDYAFPKPGSEKPVDKISYVKKMDRWNWVVGAGHYIDDLQKTLNRILFGTLTVLFILIAGAVAVTLMVSRQISVPLKKAVEAMEKLGNGNFDVILGQNREDEIGRISCAFDKAVENLREIFVAVRSMGVKIASNSVRLIKQVDVSASHAREQSEISNDIFASSKEATAAHGEISNNTQKICASTSSNLDKAKSSFKELMDVNGHMNSMADKIEGYTRTINQMDAESQEIKKIVTLIKSIATQTSLLSLNAAIEAARAGQAGKGFAIVADEVKKLAEEVNIASENIAEKINAMLGHIETSIGESKEVAKYAQVTKTAVAKSCDNFKDMIVEFERNDDQLQGITASVEELSAANDEIHGKVTTINEVSQEVAQLMEEAKNLSEDLYEITETLLGNNSRFKTGRGYGEVVVTNGMDLRRKVRDMIEEMNSRGVNVFDQNYQPIPGTNPQKYRTAYDETLATRIQPLLDGLLNETKGCSFVLCVDANGYAPTHNSIYSRPLTGDYETDRTNSRDKRMFDDKAGLKSARNTKPVLLHSYLRDTGEVLSEFALPIKVAGKHWGAIRIGIAPEMIMD